MTDSEEMKDTNQNSIATMIRLFETSHCCGFVLRQLTVWWTRSEDQMVKIPGYNYILLASCFTAVKLNLIVKILNIMRVLRIANMKVIQTRNEKRCQNE